ncbi:hypothetical protein LJR069_004453 [Variovorax paradoxus]|uniref:hypothetical protein n=1 Tax=Variovorax paradoxus TaxID=34073 RepID=UPI003ECDEC7A
MGAAFDAAENPVEWLQANEMPQDAAKILKCVTFPAVLSVLHCLYEALECSRKGKLNVTYMLLRKPLQESLYVFEEIVIGGGGSGQPILRRRHEARASGLKFGH